MQHVKQRGIGFTVSVSDASLAFATRSASKKSTDAKPKHGFNQVSDSNADQTVQLIVHQFSLTFIIFCNFFILMI